MALVMAFIPLIIFYFGLRHIYKIKNKEFLSIDILLTSFIFGIVSLVLVLFVNKFFIFNIFNSNLFIYFTYSAFIEESMKFLSAATAIYIINKYTNRNMNTFDIIVIGTFIGLGFGVAENFMYLNGSTNISSIISLGFLRMLFSLPSHILYTVLNSLAYKTNDKKYFFGTFILTIVLHSMFNISSTLVNTNHIYYITLLLSISIELYLLLKIFEEGSLYVKDDLSMLKFMIMKRTQTKSKLFKKIKKSKKN